MKILARFIVISSLLIAFSGPLQARGNAAYEETYNIGVLAGNIDGGAEYGSVEATGFVLSARNKKAVLEYVNVTSDAGSVLSTGDDWEANISGFYLSLLGEGQPYMKFKVGKIKQEMVLTTGAGSTTAETTSVTSYGIGLGYKIGTRISVELDITTLDNDMTLMALSVLF